MKAAVLREIGKPLHIEDMPVPPVGPGEALEFMRSGQADSWIVITIKEDWEMNHRSGLPEAHYSLMAALLVNRRTLTHLKEGNPMKLSSCTMIYLDYTTLEEAICRIAKSGFQGVDIWAYSPHLDVVCNRGDRQEIRKLVEDQGLEITALSVVGGALAREYNFSHSKEWVRRDTLDYYKKCLDVAAEIGCPRINVISGHMMADTDFEQAWAWNREGMKAVAEYAASLKVTPCLHTLTPSESRVVVTLDDTIKMMREINLPGCRLMIDTADQNIADVNITDAVRKVAPYLDYVHFSDNEGQRVGLTHNIPGHGTMNWGMFVRTLKEVGYTGYLTAQLYAGHTIDPDAWQDECFRYMKGVMQECGVWEGMSRATGMGIVQ